VINKAVNVETQNLLEYSGFLSKTVDEVLDLLDHFLRKKNL